MDAPMTIISTGTSASANTGIVVDITPHRLLRDTAAAGAH